MNISWQDLMEEDAANEARAEREWKRRRERGEFEPDAENGLESPPPPPTLSCEHKMSTLRQIIMGVLERAGPMENRNATCDELVQALTQDIS